MRMVSHFIGIVFLMFSAGQAMAGTVTGESTESASVLNHDPFLANIESYAADVEKTMLDSFNGRIVTNQYRFSIKKGAKGPLVRIDMPAEHFNDHIARSFINTSERMLVLETLSKIIIADTPLSNHTGITPDEIGGPWFGKMNLSALRTNSKFILEEIAADNNTKKFRFTQKKRQKVDIRAAGLMSAENSVDLGYNTDTDTLGSIETSIVETNGKHISIKKHFQYSTINNLPILSEETETNEISMTNNLQFNIQPFMRISHTVYKNIELNGLMDAYFKINK